MLQLDAHAPGGCSDGLSRRGFLRLGAAGLTSLGLPQILQARSGGESKDTRVILIWLEGGPSHIDLWDMKPAAPAEYRGFWRPIPTKAAGLEITEMFPSRRGSQTGSRSSARSITAMATTSAPPISS